MSSKQIERTIVNSSSQAENITEDLKESLTDLLHLLLDDDSLKLLGGSVRFLSRNFAKYFTKIRKNF